MKFLSLCLVLAACCPAGYVRGYEKDIGYTCVPASSVGPPDMTGVPQREPAGMPNSPYTLHTIKRTCKNS